MAITQLRQDTQVRSSLNFNDSVVAGVSMQSLGANLEFDLNAIRSQLRRLLYADDAGNWFDDVPIVNGQKRAVKQLGVDLDAIEEKRILCRVTLFAGATVAAAKNWHILSVSGGEAPSLGAAVNGGDGLGAVVASSAFSGAGFDVHESAAVAGSNNINPKNLLSIRDSSTGEEILSGSTQVFGLLQCEAGVVDGDAFDDLAGSNRVKVSFVRVDSGGQDFEPVPVADIEGRTFDYAYVARTSLSALPEDCFVGTGAFVDQSSTVDVTRQQAYDSQGAAPVNVAQSAALVLGSSLTWSIRDALGADLLRVTEDNIGSASAVVIAGDADLLDVNAANSDFANGATFGSGSGNAIQVSQTAGAISSAAGLLVEGGSTLALSDGNRSASTWAAPGVFLSSSTAEWSDLEAAFASEPSILGALLSLKQNQLNREFVDATVQANLMADVDVGGPATANNLDVNLLDYGSTANMLANMDIYLNGQLLRGGSSGASGQDYYPGTTTTQIRFTSAIKSGDKIRQVLWSLG